MIIVRRPSASDTKYGWLCIILDWTTSTSHDLIKRNLWPKPEITSNQKLNTMPMHDKPWGTELDSWKSHGTAAKAKTWAESSTKLTTPRSISTAATMDRSTISYDPYLSTHVFIKVNIDATKPTDKIWIVVSHVFLPTFWCVKCNSWSSHHEKIYDEHIRWQNMKYAQIAKQVEYRKQTRKVTTSLLNNRTDHMVEMTITNDLTQHTVVITTKTNVHEIIADDHPQEIAPAPTRAVRAVCAAQAITTEMVQHSTMTKRNIISYNNT
jgi:hypothetical protein